jgi:hypothetical protein
MDAVKLPVGTKMVLFGAGGLAVALGLVVGQSVQRCVDNEEMEQVRKACAAPDECICHCRCEVELPDPPPPSRPNDKPEDWYEP